MLKLVFSFKVPLMMFTEIEMNVTADFRGLSPKHTRTFTSKNLIKNFNVEKPAKFLDTLMTITVLFLECNVYVDMSN